MTLGSHLGKERKDDSASDLDAGAQLCHRGQCQELSLAFLEGRALEGRAEDSESELTVRAWR